MSHIKPELQQATCQLSELMNHFFNGLVWVKINER